MKSTRKSAQNILKKIKSGEKTFEYRVNDFDCEPGDILILEEYEYLDKDDNIAGRRPTGRSIRKKVGHVVKTLNFDWLNRPDVKADFEKYGTQIISLLDE